MMTDHEIEILVDSFKLPPPFGPTESEKKWLIEYIKGPGWLERIEKRKTKST